MKVFVGWVVRSWGLDGSMIVSVPVSRLAPKSGDEVFFEREGVTCLGIRNVVASRPYGTGGTFCNRQLLRVSGICSPDDVETVRGCAVMRELATLPERVFLNEQLIGSSVITMSDDGSRLFFGTVTAVIPAGGSYRLLAVRRTNGEALIPFVRDVVCSVDTDARTIVVRRVDGVTA